MVSFKDMLSPEYEQFERNADFLWDWVLSGRHRESTDQEQFMKALEESISYLNGLKLEEVKCICRHGDMAEKVSMIIDLRDYVYTSLEDELNS